MSNIRNNIYGSQTLELSLGITQFASAKGTFDALVSLEQSQNPDVHNSVTGFLGEYDNVMGASSQNGVVELSQALSLRIRKRT